MKESLIELLFSHQIYGHLPHKFKQFKGILPGGAYSITQIKKSNKRQVLTCMYLSHLPLIFSVLKKETKIPREVGVEMK